MVLERALLARLTCHGTCHTAHERMHTCRLMKSMFIPWRTEAQLTRACIAYEKRLLAKAWLAWRSFATNLGVVKALLAEEHRCKVLQALGMLGWRAVVTAQRHHVARKRASDAHYNRAVEHRAWHSWRVRDSTVCIRNHFTSTNCSYISIFKPLWYCETS